VAGNRCATYPPPGCDGSQLRARHGQAPQVRKYNWRWRAAFTILCLFPSFASSCQPSQKASATPTIFYDSLSFFCLSTFPESFSYSNNILRFSLLLLLVNLPRKLQLLQQYFTDSLSLFCLSTFPESFSYSNTLFSTSIIHSSDSSSSSFPCAICVGFDHVSESQESAICVRLDHVSESES